MKRNDKFYHNIARFSVVMLLVLFFALGISIMAFRTTVIYKPIWDKKAQNNISGLDTIKPIRGEILASDGSILATNITVYDVRMDYRCEKFDTIKFVERLDSLSDSLARYFPRRNAQEWKAYLKAPLELPHNKRPRAYNIARGISYSDFLRLKSFPHFKERNPNRTGFTFESRNKREYPYGDMARRSVGRVSESSETKEIHGFSGLEAALDNLLYGSPGMSRKVFVTRNTVDWVDQPSVPGSTLTTTIDINMQDIVENELESMLKSVGADWGTVVLMEAATGDIKAIANLEHDSIRGGYVEAMNRAVQRFEPGSVIKLVGMLIALEDGFAPSLETTFVQRPFVYHGGKPISDTHYEPSQKLSMMQILEYSSNICMTRLVAPHYEKNPNGFRERVKELGLLEPFNTHIAGETTPYYPKLSIKSGGLVSLSRMIYGYSTMIPPLYTCAFYNAVANGGKFVRPRLVSKITSADGVDSVIPVTYVRERICSEKNASILRDMLRRVVTEKGGTAKQLKDDRVAIAGKTGTAIVTYELPPLPTDSFKRDSTLRALKASGRLKTGYREGHYRLAFCGMFPYENPMYTCMVLISNPSPGIRSAQLTSGMVCKNIALKFYSRGLLGNKSDYRANPLGEESVPVLYASYDDSRQNTIKKNLSIDKAKHFPNPSLEQGGVPDLKGLGLREAVVALETAGLNHKFKGEGFVVAQSLTPGSRYRQGDTIRLTLQQR